MVLPLVLASGARAQGSPRPGRVVGIVRDSLTGSVLAGALIQLVGTDSVALTRGTVADSSGRFQLADVPSGRYLLGFQHPRLDSLPIELTPRRVDVRASRTTTTELALPGPSALRRGLCGPATLLDAGLVLGVVRDVRDRQPRAGAQVVVRWVELTLGAGGTSRAVRQLATTTATDGWFALCGVPARGLVALAAAAGGDSTDLLEFELPPGGVLRRDLYPGGSRVTIVGDSVLGADSSWLPPRRTRSGAGVLAGRVIEPAVGRPLAGIRVGVADGPQTRTDADGAWRLVGLPGGTRMLDVRGIGYAPLRLAVDVIDSAPPLAVALLSTQAMLDTVRVRASIPRAVVTGFSERRRSFAGRFYDSTDVARRHPTVTTDLFRMIPGMYMDAPRGAIGDAPLMRSAFGDRCVPSYFLDGMPVAVADALDLDNLVRPGDIKGLEIYADGTVPAEFQLAMTGCGAVVIWTRRG